MKKYTIALNSDRAHLCLNGTPVETKFYSDFCDTSAGEDAEYEGKHMAIGFLVCKALQMGYSGIMIEDKSK